MKLSGDTRATHDDRQVIVDVHARYFGAELNDKSITSGDHPRLGRTRFDAWLQESTAPKAAKSAAPR